jgi:triacylglycerol esterase/lipase EstA (alpha/beta hydrolase family)
MTTARPPSEDPSALRRRRILLRGRSILLAVLTCGVAIAGTRTCHAADYSIFTPAAAAANAQAALARAQEFDRAGQQQAVDLYFQAAAQAADVLLPGQFSSADTIQIEAIYRQALSGLIDAGQRYGRLDPRGQLTIVAGGTRVIPLRYFGFAWQPCDFSRLVPADTQSSREISRHYTNPGLGLPLIVERVSAAPNEMFFREWQPFAATALLRPASDLTDAASPSDPSQTASPSGYVLELYNPFAFNAVMWRGVPCPLAGDLTAPLAALVNEVPRKYLQGFTAPTDTAVRPKLFMLEPCQRGKIPVIFIHGLYSDAITWVDMINDLRSQRDLYDRYQFWTFRYPTGGDLLTSTAVLRQNLHLVQATFDPEHTDPALNSIVLVGHSLGGLVSKMQVATSYDLLWREAATQPFSSLRAPPEMQERLARGFFFQPVPSVKRVIFIGTPHRGSGLASRLAGRIGSELVEFGTAEEIAYQELMDQNADLFKPFLQRQRPTTITMLDPDNPFLNALSQMPVSSQAHLHSIIGDSSINPLTEPGDGVVPISSARHYGKSELFVVARHEKLHQVPETIAEVARILRLNTAEVAH